MSLRIDILCVLECVRMIREAVPTTCVSNFLDWTCKLFFFGQLSCDADWTYWITSIYSISPTVYLSFSPFHVPLIFCVIISEFLFESTCSSFLSQFPAIYIQNITTSNRYKNTCPAHVDDDHFQPTSISPLMNTWKAVEVPDRPLGLEYLPRMVSIFHRG